MWNCYPTKIKLKILKFLVAYDLEKYLEQERLFVHEQASLLINSIFSSNLIL